MSSAVSPSLLTVARALPRLFLAMTSLTALSNEFSSPTSRGTVDIGELREASGLAASRSNDGVLWTHNDAGGGPRIFAIGSNGASLGSYDLPKATKVDYEDIAIGPGPAAGVSYLYLGDIGDNNGHRASIQVYQIPEPAVYARQAANPPTRNLKGVRKLDLVYPDGPHNAETLMVDPVSGDLLLATKEQGRTRFYSASQQALDAGGQIVLAPAAEVAFDSASGGDITAAGDAIVLRQENLAWMWTRRPGQTVAQALAGTPAVVPVVGPPDEPNGEAIAFDPAGRGYYTLSDSTASQPLYFAARTDGDTPEPPRILVPAGAAWNYLDAGTDPGAGWKDPLFDDHGWKSGEAPFGYGDGDEQTVVSYGGNTKDRYITTLFRRSFDAEAAPPRGRLELRLLADDGAAVYLNGVLAVTQGMSPGSGFKTPATSTQEDLEDAWVSLWLDPALLHAGTNLIAVEVHQAAANSPDLTFDAQLVLWERTRPAIRELQRLGDGSFQIRIASTAAEVVVLVSADLQDWTALATVVPVGGEAVLVDAAVPASARRFYRVVE